MVTIQHIRERFWQRPVKEGDLFFHGTSAAEGDKFVKKAKASKGKHDFGEGFYTWKDNYPENDGVVFAMSWALSTSCLSDCEIEPYKSTNNPLLFVWKIPKTLSAGVSTQT